jgi:proteasome lid subunit RPN8/RPN11
MTAATADAERDTAGVDTAGWPRRRIDASQGVRTASFQVVYKQSAIDQIHLHGQSKTDVEVCGVLIGQGHMDDTGPYLLVEHAIRGTAAASKSTNVTFTAETWQQIQTVMDRDYADKKMVGWYHTHPGFGIFLSDMDVFICDNFFNLPWQSAFVYDPVGGDEGNFLWRAGRPTREPILIEDDVTPAASSVPLVPVADAVRGAALVDDPSLPVDHRIVELMARVRRLEKRLKILVIATAFLAAFVIMWVVSVSNENKPAAGPLQSTTRPR